MVLLWQPASQGGPQRCNAKRSQNGKQRGKLARI